MRAIGIPNPYRAATVDEHITTGLDRGCRREMAGMAGTNIAEACDGGHNFVTFQFIKLNLLTHTSDMD